MYVWAKEAFGDFHGFVAGWTYWIYTFFYFPGLLLASAAMSAYIIGRVAAQLAQNRTFFLVVSFALLLVAVGLNIIGLNIGKWLQNAGGVGDVHAAVDAGRIAALIYGAAWIGDAFHLGHDAAALGLGHGEFLVADRVCIYGTGTRFRDERGNPRSAAHFSARDSSAQAS